MYALRFTAGWCRPCQAMKPIVDKMRDEGYDIIDVVLDHEDPDIANANLEFMSAAGVQQVPTFILMDGNNEVRRHSGAMNSIKLKEFLDAQEG